jgi:hypothetical protein
LIGSKAFGLALGHRYVIPMDVFIDLDPIPYKQATTIPALVESNAVVGITVAPANVFQNLDGYGIRRVFTQVTCHEKLPCSFNTI